MSSRWRQEWAQAVRKARGLSMTARMVAQVLALDFANDDTGQCNPSHATLAAHLDVSTDTIKRALRELTNAGWLTKQAGRHRGQTSSFTFGSPGKVIALDPEKGGTDAPQTTRRAPEKGGQECPPKEAEKGGRFARKGGQICTALYKGRNQVRTKGARACPWASHTFTGRASPGPLLVRRNDHAALSEWGQWTQRHNLPPLLSLPVVRPAEKGYDFVALPSKRPPDTPEATAEALTYFRSLIDEGGARHAAQ